MSTYDLNLLVKLRGIRSMAQQALPSCDGCSLTMQVIESDADDCIREIEARIRAFHGGSNGS